MCYNNKMNLITFIFILMTLTLNAIALETILNPYENLEYDQINVYDYQNDCECYQNYQNYQ